MVIWVYKTHFIEEARSTNIFIAAFTACHGRMKLYDELDKIGVLYYDTDSIIYIDKPSLYNPKLGNNLGNLTSELGCKAVNCTSVNS